MNNIKINKAILELTKRVIELNTYENTSLVIRISPLCLEIFDENNGFESIINDCLPSNLYLTAEWTDSFDETVDIMNERLDLYEITAEGKNKL